MNTHTHIHTHTYTHIHTHTHTHTLISALLSQCKLGKGQKSEGTVVHPDHDTALQFSKMLP